MKSVCCVGIAVADVVASPVRVMPSRGKLELVDNMDMYTGGCAVNAAIDLAKIGIDTSICALIGKDSFGDFIKSELSKYGVSTKGISEDESVATSSSIVISHDDGERSFLHNIAANGVFSLKHINWEVIEESDVVFVAGALLMPRFDGQETKEFLQKVKSLGKITVLDTAWDSTGRWMDLIEGCLPYVDFFIPSIEEARMLSGEEKVENIVKVFKNKGAKNIIIKMGEDGSYVNCENEVFVQEIFKVDVVVDTNGAGDSFVAGFIAGLVNGYDIKETAVFASAVGAHCVQAVGASSGIVKKAEIIEFINSRK